MVHCLVQTPRENMLISKESPDNYNTVKVTQMHADFFLTIVSSMSVLWIRVQ